MPERSTVLLLTALAVAVGCGKKADGPKAKDDAPLGVTVAPVATPTIGVDQLRRMNHAWGSEGSTAYTKAVAAYRAKPHDWAGVRTQCETALAKDPHHMGAHWLLGFALAQAGDHAAAVDHLVTALAADYGQYFPSLTSEADLKPFLATSHGASVMEVAARIHDDYNRRAANAILLVGRRSSFKWPEKPGVQSASSRGELYAFDRETKRYLRLTHTDDEVVGFVRAPSGAELAVLAFDRLDRPKADELPPLITRAYIQVLDTKDWSPVGQRVNLTGATREISVGYGAGDQLLVSTAPALGRWGVGPASVSSIDRSTGKLTKVALPPPTPRIVFSLEEGHLVRAADGVKATWTGDPPTAPALELAGKSIPIPESGAAAQTTLAVAPTSGHIAFATAVDSCSKDTAPSLYFADGKTGALKHLLTAKSRFSTRWLDATTLAYEDGDGAIRLWDATTGREALKLENRPGLALDVLSISPAPLCKQAPPSADAGSGSGDEPMPPEEGAGSGGPVTTP
jgi:hypothetical protein